MGHPNAPAGWPLTATRKNHWNNTPRRLFIVSHASKRRRMAMLAMEAGRAGGPGKTTGAQFIPIFARRSGELLSMLSI